MQKFPVACVFGVALACSVVLSVSQSSVEAAPRLKGRAPKPAVVAAPQPVPAPSAVESTLSAFGETPTWSDADQRPLPGDSSGLRFRGSRRGEVRRQFDGRDVPDTTQLPQPRPQRQRGHLHIRSRGIWCFDPRGHGSAATCATLRRAL